MRLIACPFDGGTARVFPIMQAMTKPAPTIDLRLEQAGDGPLYIQSDRLVTCA